MVVLDYATPRPRSTWKERLPGIELITLTVVRVPHDPKDSPILQAALGSGSDLLVTNDRHLLDLNPQRGLRIVSMHDYHEMLRTEGLL